jgi:hypothetical protein
VSSFEETAPAILRDMNAAKAFVQGLQKPSDLMEVACSSTTLATLALDVHLKREGKDNHAAEFLRLAYWLQVRLGDLVEVWKRIEGASEVGER